VDRTCVILNERAGCLIGCDRTEMRELVRSRLAERYGPVDVVLTRGRGMIRAIDRAAADHDILIVGGGDGSVGCAVARLAGSGKRLGVLPLGTMNLFARDLGMPADLDAALTALARAEPRAVDLGTVNGRPFHTISGLGFFSQMARAREETRDLPGRVLRVGMAALRAFSRSGRLTLDIAIDGNVQQVEAFTVLVTNNQFSETEWRRPSLVQGLLELHVAEGDRALARLEVGADFLAGDWRRSEGIRSFKAHSIHIASPRRRVWVSTDGELRREQVPLRYGVKPRALQVLWPG
jgi:diacylglycerol kinase family enzyme